MAQYFNNDNSRNSSNSTNEQVLQKRSFDTGKTMAFIILIASLLISLDTSINNGDGSTSFIANAQSLNYSTNNAIIEALYPYSATVNTTANVLHIFGGPLTLESTSEVSKSSYYEPRLFTLIPGIAMALLSLVIWLFFGCGRCCNCGCTGGNKPRWGGYGTGDRYSWIALTLLTGAVATAFGALGIYYDVNLNSKISGDNTNRDNPSIISTVRTTVNDAYAIPLSVSNNIEYVLNNITASELILINSINAILNITDRLPAVQNSAFELEEASSKTTFTIPPYDPNNPNYNKSLTFACIPCVTIHDASDSVVSFLDNTSTSTLYSIGNATIDVKNDIINALSVIDSNVASAQAQIDESIQQIKSWNSTISSIDNYIIKYEPYRNGATIAIFALPIALFILAVLGTLFNASWIFQLHWNISFLMLFFVWLLFALTLLVLHLNADGCGFLDYEQVNIYKATGYNSRVTAVLQSCLVGTSLAEAVGVANTFNFTDIVFPTLPSNLSAIFVPPELAVIQSDVSQLNYSSFGLNISEITAEFAALNNYTAPQYYDASNVTQVNSSEYGSSSAIVRTLKDEIIMELEAEVLINGTITNFTSAVSTLQLQVESFQNLSTSLAQNFSILVDTVKPVVSAALYALNTATCAVIGTDYGRLKQDVCTDVVLDIGMMALALFIVGIVQIFSLIGAVKLVKRINSKAFNPIEGYGDDPSAENPNDFNEHLPIAAASPPYVDNYINPHTGAIDPYQQMYEQQQQQQQQEFYQSR